MRKKLKDLASNKYFIIIIFVISLVVSLGGLYFDDYLTRYKGLGLLGIFLINFFSSATFFVSGPAFLTVIKGADIYNPLAVATVASIGASMGDLVSFFLGFSGRRLTYERLSNKKWFNFVEDLFRRFGIWVIFFFAVIPNPFFDAIGLVAGVFGIKPVKFFLVMLLGRFIRYTILALIGVKFL